MTDYEFPDIKTIQQLTDSNRIKKTEEFIKIVEQEILKAANEGRFSVAVEPSYGVNDYIIAEYFLKKKFAVNYDSFLNEFHISWWWWCNINEK